MLMSFSTGEKYDKICKKTKICERQRVNLHKNWIPSDLNCGHSNSSLLHYILAYKAHCNYCISTHASWSFALLVTVTS